MPTYAFRNKETGEVLEQFMKMDAREQFLKDNPHLESTVTVPLGLVRVTGKPDDGFRDILRNIKKKANKGISRSTINTF